MTVSRWLLITVLSFPLWVAAQDNYYWIKFTDKQNNTYSLQQPEQFLSAEAIARRQRQGIALNETDLPISPFYVDSVKPFFLSIKHRLKWFNTVIVQLDSSTPPDVFDNYDFVEAYGPIETPPPGKVATNDKLEAVYPVNPQEYNYRNNYGIAYPQTKLLNMDLLHNTGHRGQGITIAVMDNGFSGVENTAPFDSARARILGGYDFVHNDNDMYNDGGHGTNAFSCIAANLPGKYLGTAPDAQYYLLQTEENGREWVMEEYNWAAAAEWADSAGAGVFSTSLGYTTFDGSAGNHTFADLDGNTTVIARAGNMAFSKGILVVNSAGNEGNSSWFRISSPADADSVMAVGAVDSLGQYVNFSGKGPSFDGQVKPDVSAQGVIAAVIQTNGGLGYSQGTSFSCPTIAGAAAALWSAFPNKTNREIFTAIVISSSKFWSPDSLYGYGIPNFYNAYLLLQTDYNEDILKVSENVTVYPNPFARQLNIAMIGDEEDGPKLIELFDLYGRKVYEREYFLRKGTFEILTEPEVGNLPAGKYVLRINRNKKYTHVVVKGR